MEKAKIEKNTTPMGFEPMRAKPIGFRVQLLNHSDTVSTEYTRIAQSTKPLEIKRAAQT